MQSRCPNPLTVRGIIWYFIAICFSLLQLPCLCEPYGLSQSTNLQSLSGSLSDQMKLNCAHLHLQFMCFVGYWPFDCTSLNQILSSSALNPLTVLAFTTDSGRSYQRLTTLWENVLSLELCVWHLGFLSLQLWPLRWSPASET